MRRGISPMSAQNEAAQESNLPTDGLHRPAGFEDRMGHRAPAAPRRAVYGLGASNAAYSASASASTPSLARRRMRSRVSSIRSRSSAVSSSATDGSDSGGSYVAKAAAGGGGGW